MEYAITIGLTLAISFAIIKFIKYKEKLQLKRVLYRQSDMHQLLKVFFSRDITGPEKLKSQLNKYIDDKSISVLIIENKAYWVSDNIFYVADAINNSPVLETATPVDTSNMSRVDVDKMMFILDNLNRGKRNDDSSSGNN